MRVTFISGMTHDTWGGSEVLWSETAAELASRGHEVLAIVQGWPHTPEPIKRLRQRNVRVYERPTNLAARIVSFLTRRLGIQDQLCPSWRQVRLFKPDLICVANAGVADGAHWMHRSLQENIPYCSICQANGEHWWPEDGQLSYLRRAFQGARRAFFVSQRNLDLFERQIGERMPRSQVVSNPFGVSWQQEPCWPTESAGYRLACVARLYPPAKGHDLLFQVLAQEKWKQRNLTVTLYGKGPMEAGVRSLSTMLGLESIVQFAGQVNDIAGLWRENHALVLPSRYEGQPLSLIEAMICRRTAITTLAGSADLIQDNVTGFLAQAPTVEHLDEALERAWVQRSHWHEFGLRARASIEQLVPHSPPASLADELLRAAHEAPVTKA